jgi:peptidyl-prolyl cis-trans isomerase A (cyclophilin A)
MGRFDPGETYGGFCICVGDQPELDHGGRRFPDGQGASAFGRVVEGMHVVRRIHARATANEFLAEPIPIITVVAIPQCSGGSLRAN